VVHGGYDKAGQQKHLALVRRNIVEALYIYAEAVKQLIIHAKHRKKLGGI